MAITDLRRDTDVLGSFGKVFSGLAEWEKASAEAGGSPVERAVAAALQARGQTPPGGQAVVPAGLDSRMSAALAGGGPSPYPLEGRGLPPGMSYSKGGLTIPLTTPPSEIPSPFEVRKFAYQIRQDFQTATKSFDETRRQASVMNTAFTRMLDTPGGTRNAIDQAIINTFNRMLEPGSTTRESEYARSPEGISKMNQLQAWWERLSQGGAGVTDEDRKEIVGLANEILDSTGGEFNRKFDETTGFAKEVGLDEKFILGGVKRYEPDKALYRRELAPPSPAQLSEPGKTVYERLRGRLKLKGKK